LKRNLMPILLFLVLIISLSFSGCGKKAPLILKDRVDSSRLTKSSEEAEPIKK
jgi:predicted small lipoprotein YifL